MSNLKAIPDKVMSALGSLTGSSSSSSGDKQLSDPATLAAHEKKLQEARRVDPRFPAAKDGRLKVTPQSEIKTDANTPMLAGEWTGKNTIVMRQRASPMVTDAKDAIIRVTSLSVCGTDIHVYKGQAPGGATAGPLKEGDILGHEAMGVVESLGPEVRNVKVGDRVVISAILACGECAYCQHKQFSMCESTNPSAMLETMQGGRSAGLMGMGHPNGGFSGCQAERVRVPLADVNLLPIPDSVPDTQALLLSDILCTAWHGLERVELKEGQTVAIWGGGPVGQLCAYLAIKVRKASRVVLVDSHAYRLEFAKQWGVDTVNRSEVKSVTKAIQDLLPEGGVDACVDCAGFRFAKNPLHRAMRAMSLETDTPELIMQMFTVCKPCGYVSLIGEYFGMANAFPVGMIMQKDLTVRGGPVYLHKYWKTLLTKIESGELDMTPFYTHRAQLSDLPSIYTIFAERKEHVIKPFIETEFGRARGADKQGNFTLLKDRPIAKQMNDAAAATKPVEPQNTSDGAISLHGLQWPSGLTATEQRNLEVVVQYMNIAYNPTLASAANVKHLCAAGNKFHAPTTFPSASTAEEYADAHAEVMRSLPDLHFESFDILFVKDDQVALRYSATGTHKGVAHGNTQPTQRTAHWTAAGLFQLSRDDGKIVQWTKEWNKLHMWQQLGWPIEECFSSSK